MKQQTVQWINWILIMAIIVPLIISKFLKIIMTGFISQLYDCTPHLRLSPVTVIEIKDMKRCNT